MSTLKRIIVSGAKYEQVFECPESEFAELLARVRTSVEIWNRDRPKNQRQVVVSEDLPQ